MMDNNENENLYEDINEETATQCSESFGEEETAGQDEPQEKKTIKQGSDRQKSNKDLKKLTTRISELEKELEKQKEKESETMDRYMRLNAEYDNYRKRTVKEKDALYANAVSDTVVELLPVIDNFERAIDSSGINRDDMESYQTGIELIYKQLKEVLVKIGVEPISAEGSEFDPNMHNAVMHIEDETLGDNVVAEELQKGYMFKDKVIRHSMVKVAN